MAGKLSKRDYERVLSMEYGFPVFLNDNEYAKLQVSRPAPEVKHAGYADPFAHVEHKTGNGDAKPKQWTTAPGKTYNSEHGRKPKGAVEDLGGDDRPTNASTKAADAAKSGPNAPASASIGKLAPASAPSDADYAPKLTPNASMAVGVEYLNGYGEEPVEDLGGDDRPTTLDEQIADQEKAALAAVPANLATLPQTYKQGYAPGAAAPAYVPKSMLPQWQSDEAEVDALNAKYAALMAGR